MKPVAHTIEKTAITTEEAALQMVLDLNDGLTADDLQPAHTDTDWNWLVKSTLPIEDNEADGQNNAETETPAETPDFPFGLHTVAKSESLQDAKKSAMEHFKTFEGNIKRVESEEDEEHFVFTRVR